MDKAESEFLQGFVKQIEHLVVMMNDPVWTNEDRINALKKFGAELKSFADGKLPDSNSDSTAKWS